MNPSESWQPCESGELSNLRGALVRADLNRKAAKFVSRGAYAMAACFALFAVSFLLEARQADTTLITCEDCGARFEAYHAHLAESTPMPSDQLAEMELHLAECDYCREKFDQKYPGVLPVALASLAPLLFLTIRHRAARQ